MKAFSRYNSNLSNEAQAAMQQLYNSWTNPGMIVLDAIIVNETQVQQDDFGFSKNPIKLEKGINWRWNKTSVFRNLCLVKNINVTLYKMQSRAKITGIKSPSFKVWLYSIHKEGDSHPLYFYWIARGLCLPPVEQFSFLSEFVSENIAKELNWT